MRHQLAHRDLTLAVRADLGPVVGDRLLEADFPLLDQLHHRRGGGDYLGQRCEVEYGAQSHNETQTENSHLSLPIAPGASRVRRLDNSLPPFVEAAGGRAMITAFRLPLPASSLRYRSSLQM